MRTGDTVRHIPSGQTWTVAWADEHDVMPCGWPEGYARPSDCVVIETCSDEEHWKLVREIAKARPDPGCHSRRISSCAHYLDQKLAAECAGMMRL